MGGSRVIKVALSIEVPDWLARPLVALVLLYRRLRYGYPFRWIPLTQGKYAIVDPEDYERLNKYKWHVTTFKHTFYAVRTLSRTASRKAIKMHREILSRAFIARSFCFEQSRSVERGLPALGYVDVSSGELLGVPDWLFVDHINHNGLDNRKANLRLATRAQNNWNRRKVKAIEGTSRFKGVHWHKYEKKWAVSIQVNKTRKTIGYFDDEIEAAKAYDAAAKKYHGEFAVLNFENH